jgi:hypothetical protein
MGGAHHGRECKLLAKALRLACELEQLFGGGIQVRLEEAVRIELGVREEISVTDDRS